MSVYMYTCLTYMSICLIFMTAKLQKVGCVPYMMRIQYMLKDTIRAYLEKIPYMTSDVTHLVMSHE